MRFARHQTFYLRAGWLAKALDELEQEQPFSGDSAPVRLGIGKNMVQSLRFWVQACNIAEIQSKRLALTRFGSIVKQYDPFFEADLTWWLIHYHIATNRGNATAWNFLFNELRVNEFSRLSFIEALSDYAGSSASESSYQKDFDCIVASYYSGSDKAESPEDNTECPLRRLGLLRQQRRQIFRKSSPPIAIPLEVLYLAIANALCAAGAGNRAINVADLLKPNNIGPIFNLSMDTIYRYLDQLQEKGWVRFSRTAGLDSVLVEKVDEWKLIEATYQGMGKGVNAVEA